MLEENYYSKERLTEAEREILDNTISYVIKNRQPISDQYYTVKTSNNQNKRLDIFQEIDLSTYQSKLLDVSIVILTANYFEAAILNYNMYKNNDKKILKLKDGLQLFVEGNIIDAYIIEYGQYTLLHLHAPETGSHTPCGSADLVRYVNTCEFVNPTCIISFGICFGTDINHFSLGDTIIAEKIYPWSIGIKIDRDDWNIKCDDYIIDLTENAKVLFKRIDQIINETQQLCPDQKARLGHMLTSEAVVSNNKVKIEAINRAHTCNIVAGEMEGYGLAKEGLFYSNNPKVACLILKAICDWGALKNIDNYIAEEIGAADGGTYKDQIQAYTAFCAYKVLSVLLDENVFDNTTIVSYIYDGLRQKHSGDYCFHLSVLIDYLKRCLDDENNFFVKKYRNLPLNRKNDMTDLIARKICEEHCQIDPERKMIFL